MSEFTKSHNSLTQEQTHMLEIGDSLKATKFSLWGHGTPVELGEPFFQDGLHIENSRITSTAIPLDSSNIQLIDDWPHRRYNDHANVVLLAVPDADPANGVTISTVDEYLLEQSDPKENKSVLAPEYIVGFYSQGNLTPNPGFDIAELDHAKTISSIIERKPKGIFLFGQSVTESLIEPYDNINISNEPVGDDTNYDDTW